MSRHDGARLRAEWLLYCLSIGWTREELSALEKMWDQYHDENGKLLPPAPPKEPTP